MTKKTRMKISLLAFFVLIVAGFYFSGIDYSKYSPEKIKEVIRSLGLWGPVLYILFSIIRPFLLFPASLLILGGGAAFGPYWGTVYTVIGSTACALWEFLAARYLGRKTIKKWFGSGINKVDAHMEKHGIATLLLIRIIPNIPYDMQNCGLGLTKIKFSHYAVGTFFGMIPLSFLFCYFGDSLAEGALMRILIIILVLLILVLIRRMYMKRQERHHPEAETLHEQHTRNETQKEQDRQS